MSSPGQRSTFRRDRTAAQHPAHRSVPVAAGGVAVAVEAGGVTGIATVRGSGAGGSGVTVVATSTTRVVAPVGSGSGSGFAVAVAVGESRHRTHVAHLCPL